MSTDSLLTALRPWWWLLVLVTLVGGVAGYTAATLRAPVYEASATVLVGPVLGEVDAQRAATDATATYAELATGDPALESVGAAVGLSASALRETVTVTPNSETRLIDIRARSTSAVQTVEVADAIAQQLVSLSVDGAPAAVGQVRVVASASQTPQELPDNAVPFALLAAAVALVAGAMLVLLLERNQRTVRTAAEAEQLTKLPVLAAVPPPSRRSGVDRSASAYRLLATHLEFRGRRDQAQVVAVVGVRDDSAERVVAQKVALALASAGSRVLLTDAGGGSRPDAGRRYVVLEPGLDGSVATDARESDRPLPPTLGSTASAALLEKLRDGMDFVVVTLRPLSVSADSVNWLAASDTVLLVAESGLADGYQLATAAEAIKLTSPQLAGLVLLPRSGGHDPSPLATAGGTPGPRRGQEPAAARAGDVPVPPAAAATSAVSPAPTGATGSPAPTGATGSTASTAAAGSSSPGGAVPPARPDAARTRADQVRP